MREQKSHRNYKVRGLSATHAREEERGAAEWSGKVLQAPRGLAGYRLNFPAGGDGVTLLPLIFTDRVKLVAISAWRFLTMLALASGKVTGAVGRHWWRHSGKLKLVVAVSLASFCKLIGFGIKSHGVAPFRDCALSCGADSCPASRFKDV